MRYWKKLIRFFRSGISLFKTIYFNLYYFPLSDAVKLPVFIYKNVVLADLGGAVIINGSIETGIIKIGEYNVGSLDFKCERTIWQNNGTVIFNGAANIGSGSRLSVNEEGLLRIGSAFCITGKSTIICNSEITIGNNCLLSWDILIMDTDFHHIHDYNNEIINPQESIVIGDNVWICCRNMIFKGVRICNDVVIAAGSKITKDITTPNAIIGGIDKQLVIKEKIYWTK